MAGLPHAVSGVLNDNVLTFLNRAIKVELGFISTNLIRAYFDKAFRMAGIEVPEEVLDRAAISTRGFPYLMQLIEYYVIQYTPAGGTVTTVSDNDRVFLKALARCGGTVTTARLQAALGRRGPAIQPYRKRLIEAGVIEAPRRGELVFAVPYLADYLLTEDA